MSDSPGWTEGYVSLCDAIKNQRPEDAKLLLTSGCKVNRKHQTHRDTALHMAVSHGYIEVIEMMLDQGADTEAKNKYGQTPLHIAIQQEKTEIAKLLLKHGANPNASDLSGTTLLLAAASHKKCSQIAKHLLEYGVHELNCVRTSGWKQGYTPLHFAVENSDDGVITLLLNKGANVDVKAEDNITPLHIAAEKGYICIVEELLNYGACVHSLTSKEAYTPLHFATKRGHKTVVNLLFQHGAKVDNQSEHGTTILNLAVKTGYLMLVKDVLKYCPDINNQNNKNSIKIALYSDSREYKGLVEAILEYGFDVDPEDTDNPKLLHAAVKIGVVKIVENLLKLGANVNMLDDSTCQGFTPLHTAVKNKQEQVAKLLIGYEADINARNKTGKTPIFYAIENADLKLTKLLLTNRANVKDSPELLNIAVEKKCIEIIEVLLQHDVDINASNEYGRTALHTVSSGCGFGHFTDEVSDITIQVEIIKLLLNKGANVNAKKKDGFTALHIATQEGYEEVVEVLLECDAEVDSKSQNDTTPLHVGAQKGYQKIIKTILKFGADINRRDKYGRTALYIASCEQHPEVVATLLEYGSDINITSPDNHILLDHAVAKIEEFYRVANNYDSDSDCYFDPDRGVPAWEVIAKTLACHIVKLKAANLYVSVQNLRSMRSSYEMRDFQDDCEKEIADMKSKKINNTNISFYDILAKCASSLAIYMRNENIVRVLKSDDYKTEFPIYAGMIESHFRKSMKRKELLEQGNNIQHLLFNNFPALPYGCTEKIFSYLSDEDFRTLIDACRPQ